MRDITPSPVIIYQNHVALLIIVIATAFMVTIDQTVEIARISALILFAYFS